MLETIAVKTNVFISPFQILRKYVTINGDTERPRSIVSFSYLRSTYPNILWTSSLDVSKDEVLVEVNDELYFYALNDFLESANDGDLKLYVFMKVLEERIWKYLPYGFREKLRFIGNYDDMLYTTLDCVDISLELAKEEIHSVYIGEYTKRVLDNRIQLTKLENTLSNAFQRLVSASKWIQSDLARVVTTLMKNLNLYFSPLKATLRQTSGITGGDQSFLSLCVELHKQNHAVEMGKLGSNLTVVDMDWTSTKTHYDSHLNTLGSYIILLVFSFIEFY